jgi:predicted Rossmann-fold nucleotide-binding protein
MPVILFGKAFWERVINFNTLVEEGTISSEDLDLFRTVETAGEAWEILSAFNGIPLGQ